MQNAAGERVAVHHVEQRGCVIRFLDHGGRERQQIFDLRRLLERDLAGLAVSHVFFGIIAARSREFFVFGIACPNGVQNGQRVGNFRRVRLRVRLCRTGCQRKRRQSGQKNRNQFFHVRTPFESFSGAGFSASTLQTRFYAAGFVSIRDSCEQFMNNLRAGTNRACPHGSKGVILQDIGAASLQSVRGSLDRAAGGCRSSPA